MGSHESAEIQIRVRRLRVMTNHTIGLDFGEAFAGELRGLNGVGGDEGLRDGLEREGAGLPGLEAQEG